MVTSLLAKQNMDLHGKAINIMPNEAFRGSAAAAAATASVGIRRGCTSKASHLEDFFKLSFWPKLTSE